MIRSLGFFFVVAVVGCSTSEGASDAAPVTCTTGSDCPSGQMCFFAIAEGCGATSGICASQNGACSARRACLCDGGSGFVLCGPSGYARTPVLSTDLASCTPDAGAD